eukprot:scaffold2620_cov217-Chaetoceros_neogracile.AAC.1
MARSTYEPSAITSKASVPVASASLSVTSGDDPPPPPPPRQSKYRSKGGRSIHHSNSHSHNSHSVDTSPSLQSQNNQSQSQNIQSRYYEEDDSNTSHDYSRDNSTSKSSKRHTNVKQHQRTTNNGDSDRAIEGDIVSVASKDDDSDSHHFHSRHGSLSSTADPPPPPPGQPPSSKSLTTNNTKRRQRNGLGRIPELEDDVGPTSRASIGHKYDKNKMKKDRDDHNHGLGPDDKSLGSRSSRASSHFTSNQRSTRDEKSVSSRNTKNGERRDNHRTSTSISISADSIESASVDTQVLQYGNDGSNAKAKGNSTATATATATVTNTALAGKETVAARRRRRAQEASDKEVMPAESKKVQPQSNDDDDDDDDDVYDDPPLELYSESESDDSNGDDDAAKKKGKKKSGFFKVKKFIRMGNKTSPKKKKDESPDRMNTISISPARKKKKDAPPKKRNFMSSGSKKRSGKTHVLRSAEIVVSKEKLADNERKLEEAAMRDDERSKASARSILRSSVQSYQSSASRPEKKESAFEKLRREREEKRQLGLERKRDDIQDSDVEIISGSQSDDVSEVTDPTYMTKEARRNKSPTHDLEAVEEGSSPENSPRNNSRSMSPESKTSKSTHRSKESKTSRRNASKSPESKTSKSTHNKSKESKKSRKSADDSQDGPGDSWNPNSFTGKENFVATIDPFQKAVPSTDPFDQPFYPSDSQDEPQQMFSFVYSESDAELERGNLGKDTMDTMTGLSFDSDEDDSNMDGLSYATLAAQSAATEIVKNGAESNKVRRSKKKMLPPSNTFLPMETKDRTRSISPRSKKSNPVLDSFLGIDEDSGAVTLNVASQKAERDPTSELKKQEERPKMRIGTLSQRALSGPRSRRKKRYVDQGEESGQIEPILRSFYPKSTNRRKSPERDFVAESRKSPQSSIQHSPSFILDRREKRKKREEDKARDARVEAKIRDVDRFAPIREKPDFSSAIERGRRRDLIVEKAPKGITGSRTYSPEKLRFALKSEKNDSSTRALAKSKIRSPQKKESIIVTRKTFQRTESWINKPQYDTRKLRNGLGVGTTPLSRAAFKAPAVFGNSPIQVPFKAPELYDRRTDPVLASVAHIKDPILRAGTMILSAAAIPIQAEMRRYLGVKEREDRAWGIIVVQAYFRRWKAELKRYKHLYCATRIQAAFRGWLIRDTLEDKHYYATQIQKIARGYLATMRVYENLYNITVVQSIARRNAAIKRAEDRYRRICAIQGMWRGKQCRRELDYLHWSARKIQTSFRGYTAKLVYQFDIVDIIIVQSIARRKAAIDLTNGIRFKTVNNAAIVIQRYWRSYDCTMNYLHSVADILIAQSVVRRWTAQPRTKMRKEKAARDIQKTWRGFWGYTDFVFTLADIIIVQKTVRGIQTRKRVAIMANTRNDQNAYNAAVMIQKKWRGFSAQMDMLFNLVHIIIVQSIVRRHIALIKYKPRSLEYRAAIKIQRCWRTFSQKRNFMENYCATVIQAVGRRYCAKQLRDKMFAARKIQTWYRSQATSRGYLYYMSARKIQTIWRGYDAGKLADEERWVREYAATTIQKTWRMFYQYSSYAIYTHEKKAASDIQRHWRGFWDYSHFVIMRYEASKIQALVRGTQQRKRLAQQHEAATILQAGARGLLSKNTCHMERLFAVMVYASQISLSRRIAARKIQNSFREYYKKKRLKNAALVIERFFIWVRAEVEREIERREKARIRKRRAQRNEMEGEGLLEEVYEVLNTATPTRGRTEDTTYKGGNAGKPVGRQSLKQRMT